MSPKSAQRFWDNGHASHFATDLVVFGWPIDFGLLTPYNSF
jgi:hypothetical protein